MVFIPTTCGHKDKDGYFCRWGTHGAHYHYNPNDKESKERARAKADAQGEAAYANGYRGAFALEYGFTLDKASDVQSLIFRKENFTRSQAVAWANEHGFKSGDVDETENTYRLRQFPPDNCTNSGGMKELSPGVMAYICPVSINKAEIPHRSGNTDDDRKRPKVPNVGDNPSTPVGRPGGGNIAGFQSSGNKVPNPSEPGEEDEPGEETDEWNKSIAKSYDEITAGSYIIYKGKVSKILKVLEK